MASAALRIPPIPSPAAPWPLLQPGARTIRCDSSPTGFERRGFGRNWAGDQRKWVGKILGCHRDFSTVLRAGYRGELARTDATSAADLLRKAHERMMRGDAEHGYVSLSIVGSEDELRDFCDVQARRCVAIVNQHAHAEAVERVKALLKVYGLEFPAEDDLFGAELSALQRAESVQWWVRAMRKAGKREVAEAARGLRLVHGAGDRFVSDYSVRLWRKRRARNRKKLENLLAANDAGQVYTVAELSDLSVSNPEIRRTELMVRCDGFEQTANAAGHVGEFYTLTCPSKFHPFSKGKPNAKFNGSTVGQAQDHLNRVWRSIRARLHEHGIGVYGFRVVEPHHDGTPHWHFLLFMARGDVDRVRGIFRKAALRVDGRELGAQEHRFKALRVDPAKGSATGYIAKYIAKNIDGFGLGSGDLFTGDGEGDFVDSRAGAERVVAWASSHGIRQFQQIGGPSVTVWRELRRLSFEDSTDEIEPFREAADAADWAAFVALMGGPFCGRAQALQVQRWHEFDQYTGEFLDAVQGRYGDFTPGKIIGLKVVRQDELPVVCTRFYRWVVGMVSGSVSLLVRTGSEFLGRGAQAPPWTRVNNCTG